MWPHPVLSWKPHLNVLSWASETWVRGRVKPLTPVDGFQVPPGSVGPREQGSREVKARFHPGLLHCEGRLCFTRRENRSWTSCPLPLLHLTVNQLCASRA